MTEDSFTLSDLNRLAKRLPPSTLAKFEPISGLVVLNMSHESFLAMYHRVAAGEATEADATVMRTLNHETCHFVQCLCAGYMYRRSRTLLRAFNSWWNLWRQRSLLWLQWGTHSKLWFVKRIYGETSETGVRLSRLLMALHINNHQILVARLVDGAGNAAARVRYSHFFDKRSEIYAAEAEPGPDGVSTLGVIEGAAVAYAALMEPAIRAPDPFAQRMRDDLAALPPLYAELWDYVRERAEDRAYEVMLPLAAICLRYPHPQHAVASVFSALMEAPEGDALPAGRKLFDHPPRIPEAGRPLKNADECRDLRRGRRAPLYDTFVDGLRADPAGLDSYRLLAEPAFFDSFQSFPLCLSLSDQFIGSGMSDVEIAARVLVAAQVLEVESMARDKRDSARWMGDYFREVISRNLAPPSDDKNR